MNAPPNNPEPSSPAIAPPHWATRLVAITFLTFVGVLANLQPGVFGGRLFLQAYEQPHGMPLVYMERDSVPPWADMTILHGPWPLLDATPAMEGFSWLALAVNLVIGIAVVVLTTHIISAWLQRRCPLFRKLTLLLMIFACIGWSLLAARGLSLASLPWGSNFLSYPSIMLLWIVPVVVYLLMMLLASILALRLLLLPAAISRLQATRWMLGLLAATGFVSCVVGELVRLPFAVDVASLLVVIVSAVALFKIGYCVTIPRGARSQPFAIHEPLLLGHPLLAWLGSAIVAGTGVWFIYFDVTDYNYFDVSDDNGPNGGRTQFNTYGWPFAHLLSAESNPESLGYQTADGWTIGSTAWIPFTANTMVLLIMTVGTVVATNSLMQITACRYSFRLKHLLVLSLVAAVPLALLKVGGRHVLWTHEYVHVVLGLGLAAAGFMAGKLWVAAFRGLDSRNHQGVSSDHQQS